MTFDYIIVGAGSAGCVLANRLSANENNSVLVLEAGIDDKRIEVTMPVGYPQLQKTKRDWQYWTVPQKALNNRILYQPRGKMIGGTGSMNGMIYIRGNKRDFDEWAALGCKGWSYEEVLPYFKKSENNSRFRGAYHGAGGLLDVNDTEFNQPLNDAFIEAAVSQGFKFNEDFNGEHQSGVGYYQSNITGGRRQSTARAFLYPALSRKNLSVRKLTEVVKIVLKANKVSKAIARIGRKFIEFKARKEIILCAGAINSPKLLMQSGIGDRNALKKAAIDPAIDLPGVGKNLQDHIQYFLGYRCNQPVSLNSSLSFKNLFEYFVRKKGILASAICSAGGFFRSEPNMDRPDLQFHFIPGIAGQDINNMKAQPKYDGFMLGITLLRPRSNGKLNLDPENANGKPLIDPGFLSDRQDLIALDKGFEAGWGILNSTAFDEFRGPLEKPDQILSQESEKEAFIRNTIESVYHTAGTCKMGVDVMAVTDPELRVHGIDNLRIADASIFPAIPSGNINAAVIMVAEKAAELILNK